MKKTILYRHARENLKKCSLTGLEQRDDLLFFTYPQDSLPQLLGADLAGYLLLKIGAPPLQKEDAAKGLLLIDATWRLAQKIEKSLAPYSLETRSLPKGIRTAYPRRQSDCPCPDEGLATVEALYLAHLLLAKPTEGLLDHYHWKETFFSKNEGHERRTWPLAYDAFTG